MEEARAAGPASGRVRVMRKPERASYDRASAEAVLDEALYCHVGVLRGEDPVVLPMAHTRIGGAIVLHGSTGAGTFRASRAKPRACVTATLLDGVVFAPAARNHSFNYRSAVVYGPVRELRDTAEKLAAMRCLVEHVAPGRWESTRPPTDEEIRETSLVEVAMEEWSVKVRSGPPAGPEEGAGTWCGVVPLALEAKGAVPSGSGGPLPPHLRDWRPGAGRRAAGSS